MASLEAALEYAAAGWRVIPLRPAAKLPATDDGWKSGTTDAHQIVAWFAGENYGVGICTGHPGPIVLDFDVKDGEDTAREVRGQLQRAGLLAGCGWQVRTPSGGLHMYYDAIEGDDAGARYAPALDVKAAGGYVVAPPTYISAGGYAPLTPRRPAGKLSARAVAKILRPEAPRAVAPAGNTDTAAALAYADAEARKPGESRHRLIGFLLKAGVSEEETRQWAERVKPGSGPEVEGWIRWLSKQ